MHRTPHSALFAIFTALVASTVVGCGSSADGQQGTGSADVTAAKLPTPFDWNAHADPKSVTPGPEPINFILNPETTVPLMDILQGLKRSQNWQQVQVGTGVTGLLGGACISAETATVDSTGLAAVTQLISLRVNGCLGVGGTHENHARGWKSVGGAWFFALSEEHVCVVGGKPWHCIIKDGYNIGRDDFVKDLKQAGVQQGWRVTCAQRERPMGAGLLGVVYDDQATACTVTRASQP